MRTKKTKKKYKKRKQIILSFCKRHIIKITIIGVVITVLAIVINIHYGKNTATKENIKNIQLKVEETKEELCSLIIGLGDNIPPEEPLREELKKADSLLIEKKYKEAYTLYDKINEKALSAGKEKLFVLSLIGKGISIGRPECYQGTIGTLAIGIFKIAEDYKDFLDNEEKTILYVHLGVYNNMLKNNDLAIEYYSKSLAITTKKVAPFIYACRGRAYENKGEYDRAIGDYNKAIELDPELAGTYNSRGIAYTYKGEYERAIRDHEKAIELDPQCFETYLYKAFTYDQMGKEKEAINLYNKFIELAPPQFKRDFKKGFDDVKQRIRELQKKNNTQSYN
jgi:tetratricopeptide (TPR) repeat protein